jgi:ribonucleoside-triphosphate reductase
MSKKKVQKCDVYSRVVGYLSPISNWNKGKKEEFKDRKTFKYSQK